MLSSMRIELAVTTPEARNLIKLSETGKRVPNRKYPLVNFAQLVHGDLCDLSLDVVKHLSNEYSRRSFFRRRWRRCGGGGQGCYAP